MIKNIAIIFTSIFLESLPFLILGSFISSIVETFVEDETLEKIIPKNKILGSITGIFLGFFLPACDCAVIPVSKRLIKKKVPVNVAISFMLASPIINPVVLLSTYYAFYQTNQKIFWARIILGIVISLVIGIIMGIIYGKKEILKNNLDECDSKHHKNCDCHHKKPKRTKNIIVHIFKHTAYDLFEVLKYLMIGALIASLVQVLLPRNVLTMFNSNKIISIIILMIFAYLISLCSTSDSFVGKTLLSSFNSSGIIAYLILGPMIDIKNTVVLLGNYKKRFVITLITLIFIAVFISSLVVMGI